MSPATPAAGPRRVIVLRHGETDHNAARIWQGHLDTPLSELGLRQADAVGPAIAALSPSRIVSSDLTRARLTAAERRAGVRHPGGPGPALPRDRRRRLAGAHEHARSPTGGRRCRRPWPAVRTRAAATTARRWPRSPSASGPLSREHLEALGPGECLVVSTHGASGRTAAAWLLGLEHDLAWRVLGALGNCHWAELVEGRAGWRIQTWNTASQVASSAGSPPA